MLRILFYKPAVNILVGFFFLGVVQRRQLGCSVFPHKSIGKKVIAYMGIFGKKRAVKIGTYYIFIENPLITVFPVVAMPVKHPAKRLVVSDIGSPSVIFKAYDGHGKILIFQYDIINQPGTALFCVQIHQR